MPEWWNWQTLWIQNPPSNREGSSPSSGTNMRQQFNWLEHLPSKQNVVGSSPIYRSTRGMYPLMKLSLIIVEILISECPKEPLIEDADTVNSMAQAYTRQSARTNDMLSKQYVKKYRD